MFAYLRFEIVRSLRDVMFLLFFIGLPTGLYLVYAGDDAIMQGATFPAFYLVAMASFAVVGPAMSASGPQLAAERTNGWLRQLRVTPLSGTAWLTAKLAHGLLLIVPGLLTLFVVGTLYGQVQLSAGQWLALGVTLVLGAIPFVLLGLGIGLAFTVRATQVVHTAVLFGLLFASGIFVPWPTLPEVVQAIGVVLPLHHVAAVGWEIVGSDAVDWLHIAVVTAWAAALAVGLLLLRRREFAAGR